MSLLAASQADEDWIIPIPVTLAVLAVTWLVCVLPAATALRARMPERAHLQREVSLWSLAPTGTLLAILLATQDPSWFLAVVLTPSLTLLLAATYCDAYTRRLPNAFLLLAALPLILMHAARSFFLLQEAADSCYWAMDYAECDDARPHLHPLAAPAWLEATWPWLLAAGVGLLAWVVARLSGGLGMGDVKLLPVLVLATAWSSWEGPLAALAAGMVAGSLYTLIRSRRPGGPPASPLGPWLVGSAVLSLLLL